MNSSGSQNPTSCLVILFLFPLFYHLPCASSQQELWLCKTQFQCGNITAGFPFWGGNRNERCGHPLLELHCNTNSNTSLFISDQEYYVLDVDKVSYTLTIVRSDQVGYFCSAKFITTTLLFELFEIFPTYTNLTVFYRCDSFYSYPSSGTCPDKGIVSVSQRPEYQNYCKESFTVNVPVSFFQEEEEFSLDRFKSVLREGFEVKLKIDERTCQECSSSGGTCGFNGTIQGCCRTSASGVVSCAPKRQPIADELHRRRSQPFSCGNQNDLLYPFWIPGREECGHPDFRLNCFAGYAELNILSVKFRILDVNYTPRIIRLANSDYIRSLCPPNPSNAPFAGNILLITPNTELLTIYHGCRDFSFSTPVYDSTYFRELSCDGQNGRSYYVTRNISSPLLDGVRDLLNKLIVLCSSRASIPASGTALNTLQRNKTSDNLKKALEEGFKLGVNQDCTMCMDSGGSCGYNQTSSRFLCYCKNGSENYTCGSIKSTNGTVVAILIG